MSDAHRHSPKRIVLLSDGTGNSSAKLMKTNVWRIYEAVNLTTGDQVACYDNGVGTSSFKPLAVLGGAFGWGLKRNVLHLYTYACRQYGRALEFAPGEPPRLYGFGFSRGAFTMRVLMGLIADQGLIVSAHGHELDRLAKWAYREYRRKFNATGGLVTPLRKLRDVILRVWERGKPRFDRHRNKTPEVAFLGLWDTVDAYGLPMDEMTRGWDQWVWPLSMCERTRPSNISKVCHVLAIDDERHTFHPVLLDERLPDLVDEKGTRPINHTDRERVTQVWFAGVHSNVGGGYPDDSLAHVSLLWMAAEAKKKDLDLHRHMIDLWTARADPNGPAADSRRGLGAYYRYNPRSIKKLTDDRFAEVTVERPKIHESVFKRIVAAPDEYAPIVLPDRYDIVSGGGALLDNHANPYEHLTQAAGRCADQERVWNRVWIRRVLYFSTVGATLVVVLMPFLFKGEAIGENDPRSRGISAAIHLVSAFLPEMLQPITTFWEAHPVIFAGLALLLVALFVLGTIVQRAIADQMRALWDDILRKGPRDRGKPVPPADLLYRFRSHRAYRGFCALMSQHVFPFVFGIAALLLVLVLVVGTLNRAEFAAEMLAGWTCPEDPSRSTESIAFDNKSLCQPSHVWLERGVTYNVSITLPPDWADDQNPANLTGIISAERPWVYVLALPFRRVLTQDWFVPIARIGHQSAEYHALTSPTIEITPRRSGHLYLFVNDAVGILYWRDFFYRNNRGAAATVTVTPRTTAAARP